MANKYSHLFQSQDAEEDVVALADAAFNAHLKEVKRAKKVYDAHMAKIKDVTLFEALQAMDVDWESKSRQGHPAVTVGDPEQKVQIAEVQKSAINAVLALAAGKYRELTPFVHTAHFDPTRDAQGVRMVYSPNTDTWLVYDWKRKAGFVPSEEIRPGGDENHYNAKVNKHNAITEYLLAKEFGNPWQIVLYFEEHLTHFQNVIQSRLEMCLPEVHELIANDWKDASIAQQLRDGGGSGKRSVGVPQERQEFAAELAKCKEDQDVYYTTAQSSKEQTQLFPATDERLRDQFIRGVLNSTGVTFLRFEKHVEVE